MFVVYRFQLVQLSDVVPSELPLPVQNFVSNILDTGN